MKRLNILELHRKMNEQNEKKSVCYDKVLELCHKRILTSTEKCKTSCMFEFPEYIVGMPLFDLNMCIEHVHKHLILDGFCVRYHFPKRLYISWDLEEIKRFKTEQRRQTPLTALLPQPTQHTFVHDQYNSQPHNQASVPINKSLSVHPGVSSPIIPQPQTFNHTYPQPTAINMETEHAQKPKQQLPQMMPALVPQAQSTSYNTQINIPPKQESPNNLQLITHGGIQSHSQNAIESHIQGQIQSIIQGGGALDIPSPLLPQAPARAFQSAPMEPVKYDPFDVWGGGSQKSNTNDTQAMKQMLVSNIGSSNKKKVFNYKPSGKLSLNI